jgi:DNA-binding transcriptional MerR regulator
MPSKKLREKLYYSITEIAEYFDLAPSLLRYWEKEFKEIKPKRNAKGTRFYTKKDVDQIERIHRLVKTKGFTLQGARDQLSKSKKSLDKESAVIGKLKEVKSFLLDLRENI